VTKRNTNTEEQAVNPLPWITVVFLVLGLAVLGGFYWNSTGTIKDVRYEGFNYLTKEQLQEQAKIPAGIHPDSVNLVGIMQKFEQVPYVKYARLNTEPGGTMVVNVTERTPVGMLVQGSNRAYVDVDGILLPQVLGKTPDVPLLYGFPTRPFGDTLKSGDFKATGAFLNALQQRKASDATISEVVWSSSEGVVALTNENGVKLIFGKGEFAARLRNWEAFYGEIVRKKGIKNIESVDLRFEGQIVMREK
jgi:cell division septal protein FtsQ